MRLVFLGILLLGCASVPSPVELSNTAGRTLRLVDAVWSPALGAAIHGAEISYPGDPLAQGRVLDPLRRANAAIDRVRTVANVYRMAVDAGSEGMERAAGRCLADASLAAASATQAPIRGAFAALASVLVPAYGTGCEAGP